MRELKKFIMSHIVLFGTLVIVVFTMLILINVASIEREFSMKDGAVLFDEKEAYYVRMNNQKKIEMFSKISLKGKYRYFNEHKIKGETEQLVVGDGNVKTLNVYPITSDNPIFIGFYFPANGQTIILGKNVIVCMVASIIALIGILYFAAKVISRHIELENQKIVQYQNNLFSSIVHDLKTPITAIMGYTDDSTLQKINDEAKKEEYIKAVHLKAEHMNDLVTMLSIYTKFGSEKYHLQLENKDLTAILRKCIALLYTDFDKKGINIEIEIPEEPVYAQVDSIEFSRSIMNVLTNELKYNQQGNHVFVKMEQNDKASIIIADDGKMIEESIKDHIFEPFVLGDSSRSSTGGSGLGLAITKEILEKHHWSICLNTDYDWCTKAFVIQKE